MAENKMLTVESPNCDHVDLQKLRKRLLNGARLQADDLQRLARAHLEILERTYAEDATAQIETHRLDGRRGRQG